MSDVAKFSHILVMKAGPYLNYSLDEIIDIKQEEERKCGKFFWGYGGVFCRPTVVNAFMSHAQLSEKRPVIMFSITSSAYTTSSGGRFTHYSVDKAQWRKLPDDVLLVGNKSAAHFAVVARNLRKTEIMLNLSDYCTFAGILPNENQYLDKYLRYRVDKACGFYLPQNSNEPRVIKIGYICELVEPYCVYIK